MGVYFYSRNVSILFYFASTSDEPFYEKSIVQYENGLRLARRHASDVISIQLKRRSSPPKQFLNSLHLSHVLPDVESSLLTVSRKLLPVMHKLKWSIQRDKLSRMVKVGFYATSGNGDSFGAWMETRGRGVVRDDERVRLAVCPDVRKVVSFYEGLGKAV